MKLISLLTVMTIAYSSSALAQKFEAKTACDSSIPERSTELRQECKRIDPSWPRLAACLDLTSHSLELRSKEKDFIKCLEYKTKIQIAIDHTERTVETIIFIETENEFAHRIRACSRLQLLMTHKFECFESRVPISQLNLCVGSENAEIGQRCHEIYYGERKKYIPGCVKMKFNDADYFDACLLTAQGAPEKLNLCAGVPRVAQQQQIQFRCIQSLLSETQVATCVYGDNQRGENYLTRLEGIACFPNVDETQK